MAAGLAMGAGAAAVNNVPIFLGEVGEARRDRSGWSQAAEFVSLILDSGWAWAAMAVAVGWLVSRGVRPIVGVFVGALAGCVALLAATVVYDRLEALFQDGTGGGWRLQHWLVLGVVLGLPLGAVGATIRRPGPVGVLAGLVVPIGAALNVVVLPPPRESFVAVQVAITVWGAATTAAVMLLIRAARVRRHSTHHRGSGSDDGVIGAPTAS